MDDKQAKNSWDDLLQDLGAEPDKSAFERHQAADQDIPPTVEWSEAEETAAETEESSGDWNSLADSLGLEVEQSPEPAKAPAEAKAEPPAPVEDKKQPVAKQVVEKDSEPFGGFKAPEEAEFEEDFDKETGDVSEDEDVDDDDADDFDFQEVNDSEGDDLPPLPSSMDQALSETAWEEDEDSDKDSSDEQATADEGVGVSGEAARSAFDALFSEGATGWGSAFVEKPKNEEDLRAVKKELVDDLSDALLSESSEEKAKDVDAKDGDDGVNDEGEESEQPKRKRSRRRRRGGRGRKSATQQTEGQQTEGQQAEGEADDEQSSDDQDGQSERQLSEEDSTEGEKKRPRRRRGRRSRPVEASERIDSALVDSDEDDSDSDDELLDHEDAADPDRPSGKGRGRQLHRNLPTWSEAIGMIVDANLEQRVKSPSKPQSSRGRGGRGGRGRGRRKPENS